MTSLLLGLNDAYVLCEANVLPAIVELAGALVSRSSVGRRDLHVDAVGRDEKPVSCSVREVVGEGIDPGSPRRSTRSSTEVAITVDGVVGEDSRLADLGLGSAEVPRREPNRDTVVLVTKGRFEYYVEGCSKPNTYS